MLRAKDFLPELWSILEHANGSEEKLTQLLMAADKETIVRFHQEFLRASSNLWKASDDAAAFLSKDGDSEISEDAMKDIFAFAISKGPGYYDRMMDRPEELPRDVDPGDVPALWVPGQVFWKRFNEEIMEARP